MRIAAERRDVPNHPSQRSNLIEQAVVARSSMLRFLGKFRVGEESKHAEAVVRLDDNHTPLCEIFPIIANLGVAAGYEPSAVIPNKDRKIVALRICRDPDVQIQTILAGLCISKIDV